jgi:predicted MPP superfamily phosphohydrolase
VGFIFTILGIMLALDAAWWIISVKLSKRGWRLVASIFMAAQVAGLLGIIGGRMLHQGWDRALPKFAVSTIFLWHFIGLAALLLLGLCLIPIWMVRTTRKLVGTKKTDAPEDTEENACLRRREFLGIAAAVVPPLFTMSLATIAAAQLNSFRVRRFVLPVPGLPRDLDGLTIAQVSDIHVGRFTSGPVLREMAKTVNELGADLVLLTGDLINDALADLPEGIDLVHSMHGRHGLCMIEGNHDLIENGPEFERIVRASGIPFLLNESTTISIRGCPVQLLGLRWERSPYGNRDALITQTVEMLVKQREDDAFPILLAHHPHAFDAAASAGIPLVLSGHTHGGQLMLNNRVGFGPEMFRYWSGLYTRGGSQMIVSNGVGNWFPIRVNAPAEIVHITLRLA